jgi:hypothetical protein
MTYTKRTSKGCVQNHASVDRPRKLTRVRRVRRLVAGVGLAFLAAAPLAQGQSPPSKMPALVIAVRPYGFEPAALGHTAGKVLVFVDNRSGSPQVTMHLKDSSGLVVHDFPLSSGRHHWQELVTLTPGKYTLVEDGHNNWVCTMTIK